MILGEVPDLHPRLERVDLAKFRAAFLKDKKHPPDGLRVVLPKPDVIGVEEVSLPRTRRCSMTSMGRCWQQSR